MADQETLKDASFPFELRLHKLTSEQVRQIDAMLLEVGEYGEVHIIVQRGELRYINKVESYRFWNGKEGD